MTIILNVIWFHLFSLFLNAQNLCNTSKHEEYGNTIKETTEMVLSICLGFFFFKYK